MDIYQKPESHWLLLQLLPFLVWPTDYTGHVVLCNGPPRMVSHPGITSSAVMCFKWSKKLTSSGCSLWVQCGGRLTMTIPCSLQKSTADRLTWEAWLSRINRIGSSFVGRECLTTCSRYFTNTSVVIHPVS